MFEVAYTMFLVLAALFLPFLQVVLAASRTSPPSGALVVRAGTTTSGEFKTISAAVAALPNDSSSQTIFIYPGTYTEQVYIDRSGPLTIFGYTQDTTTYTANQVNLQFNAARTTSASNDATGTLRVHKDNFRMYNVNVKNTFGSGSQAGALSEYGNKAGFYACGFYGYQDTLYANQGTQVYLKGYIEGKTDFIYGRQGQAYFGGNTIAVRGAGFITASGRESDDSGSYVFNQNTVVLASNAESGTSGGYYFGRPWSDWAKVIFKSTVVKVAPEPALWILWDGDASSVDHVTFADYNTTGVSNINRASFATQLSASQASQYSISSAVGNDWQSWVDMAYFV
ncbi:pectinesterase [Dendrothele bispora CBS 962.96]|uniref:pectinesterase n=1 Tax=Dendrothele bispora (strain CBS 962.96) TaxID=1314807 RepID=A0A4S8L518_DENBC|nr:pectinesterase [Dendrothele bispora CBS 962.96]